MQEVTDADFNTIVLGATKPVVIDFWAPWCGPCRMLNPVLESLDVSLSAVSFVKMNADDNPETPAKFGVKGLPTVIIFDGGYEVGRVVGFRNEKDMKEKLANFLTTD